MQRQWKEVPEFPPYEVSDFGEIKSKFRGGEKLNPVKNSNGYLTVSLRWGENERKVSVHTLVLELFHNKPEGTYIANHKDGNKLNNKADNLEWVSYSENLKHAYDTGLRVGARGNNRLKVKQYTLQGEFIKEHEGVREAERETGAKAISQVLIGNRWQSGNFRWSYSEEELRDTKKPRTKPVLQYSMNEELIKEYPSYREAFSETKIHGINKCCNGTQKSAGGFIWKYKEI